MTDTAADRIGSRWPTLAIVALAQLVVVLDGTIVNIALPSAQAELGMSDDTRGWVVTLYALAFGALLLLGGRIADYWGRKRSFIVGMAGFAVASAIGGLAVNGEMLLVARGLQGAFAALLAPAALSLLTVSFPTGKARTTAFAVYGTIAGAGGAIGLIVGGLLTEYVNWNWCLLVNVPIAIVAIGFAIPFLKESKATGNTRYDLPGAALVIAGFASIVYGFSRAALGWNRVDTIGFLAAGVVLLAAFVITESRSKHPLLPLRVILDRSRGGAFLVSLLVGAALLGGLLYLTLYLQVVLKLTPLIAGVASLPMTAAIIVTATLVPRLVARFGARIPMAVGGVILAVGLLLLSRVTADGSYAGQVLPGEIVIGVGLAFLFVPLQNLALSGIAEHDAGVASAAVSATQQLGGSIGTAIFTAIYSTAVTSALTSGSAPTVSLVHGYSLVFLSAAAAAILATPIALLVIRSRRSSVAQSAPSSDLLTADI